MKKINYFLIPFLFLLSCIKEEEQLPVVDSSSISMNLTDLEDDSEQYKNVLIEAESKIKFQNLSSLHNQDSVLFTKGIHFTLEGDGLYSSKYIRVQLMKTEAKTNLEYDSFYQKWRYRSLQDEYNYFYKSYDQAIIEFSVNFKYGIINNNRMSDNFKIKTIKKVMVNGKEEWAIEAEFEGIAKTPYFYFLESGDAFEIKNGLITGVLN